MKSNRIQDFGGRMKYKPTILPLTRAVAEMGNDGWTFLAGVAEVALKLNLAEQGVPPTFGCGNPNCTGTLAMTSHASRPLVCSQCGSEINWTGIATKKVVVCPTCGRKGEDWNKFCPFHNPAVALHEVDEII